MPHVTIEYSANVADRVDVDALVGAVHDAALASGLVALDALRTRAVERTRYAIADRHPDNGFVAVVARLGAGRSVDDRRRLVEALMATVDAVVGGPASGLMLSVECQEIDPTSRVNRNHLRPIVAERNSDGEGRPDPGA